MGLIFYMLEWIAVYLFLPEILVLWRFDKIGPVITALALIPPIDNYKNNDHKLMTTKP